MRLLEETRFDAVFSFIYSPRKGTPAEKLEDQIRRQKTRLSKKHREHLANAFINEAETEENKDFDIPVRTKTVVASELTLDDAIMQMELSGHSFYIYTDEESGQISVVYRRSSEGYGLIEVEQED